MPATIPEDAPGWAIRLEAKLDIAIAQHGQEMASLHREVDQIKSDRERDTAARVKAEEDLDARVGVIERAPYVTPKGLFTAIGSTIAGLAGLVAIANTLPNIF